VPKQARGEHKFRGEGLANGLELVVPTVVFTLLGLWLDSEFGTAPLLLVVCFVFGVAGTFASQYFRYRARSAAHDEGKPWTRATQGGR
jgi:F0F1-type ATP synthase assembly protein I